MRPTSLQETLLLCTLKSESFHERVKAARSLTEEDDHKEGDEDLLQVQRDIEEGEGLQALHAN